MSYWDEIDRRVTEAEAVDDGDRPDPWADRDDDGAPELTPDQREFLEALADQPAVPNLASELAGDQPADGHGPGPEPDPGDPGGPGGTPPGPGAEDLDGTGDPTG